MRDLFAVAALLLLVGCGSYEKDVKALCGAKAQLDAKGVSLDKIDRSQMVTIYLTYFDEEIGSDEGRKLHEELVAGLKKKAPLDLRVAEEAKKFGVSCDDTVAVFRSLTYDAEVAAMCGSPPKELALMDEGVPDRAKRIAAYEAHFAKKLRTPKGKALWKKLSDGSTFLAAREKHFLAATKATVPRLERCEHLLNLKTTAEKELGKGKDLIAGVGGEPNRKQAKVHLDKACKLGLETACRHAAVNNAVLAGGAK